MITIIHTLSRFNEATDEETEFLLLIEGSFFRGENPSWGYYGGSPGCPDDAEITDIHLLCPSDMVSNKKNLERYAFDDKVYYDIGKWEEKLSAQEEQEIIEELIRKGHSYNHERIT